MAATPPLKAHRPRSMAHELELMRLEHRADRLDAVLRELRRRARRHPAPGLMGRAIEGFRVELASVRQLLRETGDEL